MYANVSIVGRIQNRATTLGAIALDHVGSLYMVDTGNLRILKMNLKTYEYYVFAGSPDIIAGTDGNGVNVGFYNPKDLDVDVYGNIYIADDTCVRRVTPDATTTTISNQTGVQYFSVAIDTTGNYLYVMGTNSTPHSNSPVPYLMRMSTNPPYSYKLLGTSLIKDPPVNNPSALEYYKDYVYESGDDQVINMISTVDSSTASSKSSRSNGLSKSNDISISTSNIDSGSSSLTLTPLIGTYGNKGYKDSPGLSASFNNIRGIAFDTQDNMFVTDSGNHLIRLVTLDGVVSTVAGSPRTPGIKGGKNAEALFSTPWGIDVDLDGSVYVASSKPATIHKITFGILPSASPTIMPTASPTWTPTIVPSSLPTIMPNLNPTLHPTREPTFFPTSKPSIHTLVVSVESSVDRTAVGVSLGLLFACLWTLIFFFVYVKLRFRNAIKRPGSQVDRTGYQLTNQRDPDQGLEYADDQEEEDGGYGQRIHRYDSNDSDNDRLTILRHQQKQLNRA